MNDERTDRDHEPNASRLRDEIDRGRTGDKVAAEDPSVAPLGTDEEAAGETPSGSQVNRALEQERRTVSPSQAKGGPRTWITLVGGALALLIVLLILANWIG